ncbi:hypothetical protein GGTG_01336 [Gaeumannomyces tritici R3-111a-1]|uniref:N-acetylgalactosaminide beta-1,3-galactosyltransferase n=1 Tax=Gaeumannomyces tritici (strain R3-111a-1) TaxID=644352 RepID=J3NJA2_GAET3|nr:hypothetical protein GGTG_01336 [Gaeumannomyces tritici R3-111a-1]EJT81353.1 hypothetical protein GGTG_01336 [Gaeumannomyces tritici R3-111a-1]
MMRPRQARRIALQALAAALVWNLIVLFFLPADSRILLFFRFTTHRVLSLLPTPYTNEDWFFEPPRFPIDWGNDVAFILKTGYGTKARLPAQLDAFGMKLAGARDEAVLVVGDFSSHHQTDGQDFQVRDMLAAAMENEALASFQDAKRIRVYREMTEAIKAGKDGPALEIGKKFGWELDAMKFIPAMELAWRTLPRRKWYLMLDDDTYIIRPSLQLLLGHMDSSRPIYLGNAVGDYKGRFAHGGSGIAISEAAMRRLFDERPDAVRAAYLDSLTETWGDRLVAHTLMKVGVYLEERYKHLFNGERPRATRIRADRFCAPLISFHALAQPPQMLEVGKTFRNVAEPVLWSELWGIYRQPDLNVFGELEVREGEDHVGPPHDENMIIKKNVGSAERCLGYCIKSTGCLAWRWEQEAKTCYLAPWFIIGERDKGAVKREGVSSGINVRRIRSLQEGCEARGVQQQSGDA